MRLSLNYLLGVAAFLLSACNPSSLLKEFASDEELARAELSKDLIGVIDPDRTTISNTRSVTLDNGLELFCGDASLVGVNGLPIGRHRFVMFTPPGWVLIEGGSDTPDFASTFAEMNGKCSAAGRVERPD